ncbi:uncharacterized protein BN756_00985 [Coprobacillus sp. CAG:698]|nr:uncharacterized protein BN756_00985 [Coprobacillus sp. CAG:698]
MITINIKNKSITIPIIPIIAIIVFVCLILSLCNSRTISYKKLYEVIQEAIDNNEDELSVIEPESKKTAIKVKYRLECGEPTNFHVYNVSISMGKLDLKRIKITYSSRYPKEDYEKNLEIYNKKIEEITSQINSEYETIDKVQWVSEYICLNYEYDNSLTNRDVLSMLEDKKGVCTSYALLFKGIMDKLNIPCEVIIGKTENGYGPYYNLDGHAWNLVKIGLFWYHIDPTWMDQGSKINYDYYLKSSSSFEKVYHHQFNQIFNNNHLLWFNKETPEKQIYIK